MFTTPDQSGIYRIAVTLPQIAKIKELNGRAGEVRTVGGNMDVVDIVPPEDARADMLGSWWFGMWIAVAPDGSSHS